MGGTATDSYFATGEFLQYIFFCACGKESSEDQIKVFNS